MCESSTPPCSIVLLLAALSWIIFAAASWGILGDNGVFSQRLGHHCHVRSYNCTAIQNKPKRHSNCQNKKHVESNPKVLTKAWADTILQYLSIARLVYQNAHVFSQNISKLYSYSCTFRFKFFWVQFRLTTNIVNSKKALCECCMATDSHAVDPHDANTWSVFWRLLSPMPVRCCSHRCFPAEHVCKLHPRRTSPVTVSNGMLSVTNMSIENKEKYLKIVLILLQYLTKGTI